MSSSSSAAGPSRMVSTATALSPDGVATSTAAYSGPTHEPVKDKGRQRKVAGWKHFVAGGAGGMTGAIVTSPFDVVKTRLQSDLFREASHPPPPTSATNFLPHRIRPVVAAATRPTGAGGLLWNFVETAQMIRNISVNEGWKALFKGLGPTLVGVVPARAINFSTYAQSKILIAGWFPQLGVGAGESAEASPYVHLSAATIAGITTATATNPIWVVKTRLQLEAKHEENMAKRALKAKASSAGQVVGVRNYSTTAGQRPMLPAFRMTADILRQEGVAGLYKGLSASLIGVSEGVIQWTLYERLKRMSTEVRPGQERPSRVAELAGIVGSSGGAKMVASLITYPHEVLRTRLRQPPDSPQARPKYTGLWQTLRLVIKEEGAASLYSGLSAHLLRVIPNAACMFLTFELLVKSLS